MFIVLGTCLIDIVCDSCSISEVELLFVMAIPEGSRVNGVHNVNMATSNTSVMESTPKKAVLHGSRGHSRDDDEKAPKGTSPTLDRINLESWEGASKKPEANSLLALFKAFVTAFVKFWSE
ncbi:hypothetical protein AKJ16_DCAP14081 [Drosera capensis]